MLEDFKKKILPKEFIILLISLSIIILSINKINIIEYLYRQQGLISDKITQD